MFRLLGFFLPGGQILSLLGSIASAVINAVVWFIRWLSVDIADAFKEPQRLVVRIACALLMLGIGMHIGLERRTEQLEKWRAAHAQLLEDARIADVKNQADLKAAIKAGNDAVAAERAKTASARTPAAPPRLRKQRPAASQNNSIGPWLQPVQAVPGGQKQAKSK